MTVVLFFTALAVLVWTYAGYPLVMAAWARLAPRPWRRDPRWQPMVSVIIPARDEAAVLARKIESVLAQGWPRRLLEVLVVDDGSIDATALVARRYAADGVRVLSLGRASGKAVALNHAVARARGEVLVLTDARQRLCPDAIAHLVAALGAPDVGAVSGELELEKTPDEAGGGLGLYRLLDDHIRRWEAATGSSVGVTGALWAMHRSLWAELPPSTILDDLYQPLCVVAQGARVVVEPRARCIDAAAPGGKCELRRRVRTLAGNLQLVPSLRGTLSPLHPMYLRFASHKLGRLVAPAALVVLALTNLVLWTRPFFNLALAAQVVLYGLAAVSVPARSRGVVARVARLCRTFVMLHVAAAIAVWEFAQAREGGLWRTERSPAVAPRLSAASSSDETQRGWGTAEEMVDAAAITDGAIEVVPVEETVAEAGVSP